MTKTATSLLGLALTAGLLAAGSADAGRISPNLLDLAKRNVTTPVGVIVRFRLPDTGQGRAAFKTLLKRRNPPTAAACYNDLVAFGVMLGLRQIGIEPGDDFAVVGCDDVSEAALWNPALTSVAIDTLEMGKLAAGMLMHRIGDHGAKHREIVLEPKLVVRASSGKGRAAITKRAPSSGA